MLDIARASGKVAAITFNYRFNATVQQAREMIRKGSIGKVNFVHGFYLQDWLLYDTDFSWRLEPDKSGATCAIGDIGSHWCDTAQFMTGLKITQVLASLSTTVKVRKKPTGSREAFAAADYDQTQDFQCSLDDLASVLVQFENGARGVFSVGQVCPGHKNDLQVEVNGTTGSVKWIQERPNEMWFGYRDKMNGHMLRDASLFDESVGKYISLPAGHNEGWADAFKNLMRNIYTFIADDLNPVKDAGKIDFATFEDGYRANCIVDSIVRSNAAGSVWTRVEY
jgi:predicted dehydrogenase